MDKCAHCPLRDDDRICPAVDHPRYCHLAETRPAYRATIRARAIVPAPEPEPGSDPEAVAFPSLLQRAKNFGRAVGGHVAGGMRVAPPEVQAERRAACEACPLYTARKTCRKCGCLAMDLKRSWASESCPDSPPRWGPA